MRRSDWGTSEEKKHGKWIQNERTNADPEVPVSSRESQRGWCEGSHVIY